MSRRYSSRIDLGTTGRDAAGADVTAVGLAQGRRYRRQPYWVLPLHL